MRVLLLSDPNTSHTIKWARSLAEHNLDIGLVGLSPCSEPYYDEYANIQLFSLGIDNTLTQTKVGNLSKIKYLQVFPKVQRAIRAFKPDIVHAHFATSYGLLGALSRFRPFVLSVWGADVFDFPNISVLHKAIIKYNLRKADKILSTSQVMATETRKYTDKPIEVTPFGINFEVFKPLPVDNLFDKNDIVVGTIKTLRKKYGIDYLIKTFKLLKGKHPNLPLKLLIVGGGVEEGRLKNLVNDLHLQDDTVFTGRVNYDQIAPYHNMLSIFLSLSILDSESFGVAVIEASACETPVIVSDVGGLPEVVEHGVTGFVVPARDPEQAAVALEKLVLDKALRLKMGQAGRKRVKQLYDWNDNVAQMIDIYKRVLAN